MCRVCVSSAAQPAAAGGAVPAGGGAAGDALPTGAPGAGAAGAGDRAGGARLRPRLRHVHRRLAVPRPHAAAARHTRHAARRDTQVSSHCSFIVNHVYKGRMTLL